MTWTQEHMVTGTLRVEWELHLNREHRIEIHESHGRFTVMNQDEPYDPASFTPAQMDALVAWWTTRKEAATQAS